MDHSLFVYLLKGEGDDGFKVVTGKVKESTLVEAGPVNSSK